MKMNTKVVVALLAVLALAGAACSKKSSISAPSPNAPGGSASIPGGVTGGVPSPGGSGGTLPSGPPRVAGNLTSGEAKVQLSGDLSGSFDLPMLSEGVFAPPPSGMALVWSDTSSDLFGFGGVSFTGSQKTGNGLVLTLTIKQPSGFGSFTSKAAECTITIDTAESGKIAGSFDCKGLRDAGKTVDASGTFEASG